MKFTPSFLDEIRARLPMSEVAGQRVRLKKMGREWRGLSPFTAEKTPSFYVNDQKGQFFDFSAGKNGDIFEFVMETQGLPFPEAVEQLAALAGLALPVETVESAAAEKKRATHLEALEFAADFFEKTLRGHAGAKARAYLAERGITEEARKKFRLGYAPNERFALRDYLAAKGCDAEVMKEAGLLTHGEGVAVPYDFFRDRVMFPICDRAGKVIAFGGRAMTKEVQPKYKNSAETPLFHKGSNLYNLHIARKAAHERGAVIAVEGYVDVIAMSMVGIDNAVAGLGTALTPDQCELLWKMAEEPILCFDGDRAGRKAAFRAVETALPLIGPGRSLRFALLPEGQDPDDLARSGGASALEAVLAAAKPMSEMIFAREAEAQPLDTPERRAAFERRLRDCAGQIRDEVLKRHYLDDFRNRQFQLFGRARREFVPRGRQNFGGAQRPGQRGPVAPSSALLKSSLFSLPKEAPAPRETLILALLVNHPNLIVRHAEDLARLDFAGAEGARLRDALLGLAEPDMSPETLRERLSTRGFGHFFESLAGHATLSTLWCVRPDAHENDADEVLRQALALHRKQRALNRELRQAEAALAQALASDGEPGEANFAVLADIKAQLSALEGVEATIEGFGASSGREDKNV